MADGEYVPPLLDMPKTDKEKRHEKRVKRLRKEERKKAREEKKKELQVVATDFPQAVNHLSEEEAHRYIQKCSMDSGTNMVETAQMVLSMMQV